MTCKHDVQIGSTVMTFSFAAPPPACSFCEMDRLQAENVALLVEVAPLRAYRAAYFAHWSADMSDRREYERRSDAHGRGEITYAEFEAWCDARIDAAHPMDPRDTTDYRMTEAQFALVAEEHWPEDYRRLVEEMREEFGE